MYGVTSENQLQSLIIAQRGFLANKKESGDGFRVHNLQHLHGACKNQLKYTEEYPKFFAESTSDFDAKWGTDGWDHCGLCSKKIN